MEMSGGCPSPPFLVQNIPILENIVSPSSNILIEDAAQSNENLGDGIEIAIKYADDILIPQLDKSVPKAINIFGPSTLEKRNRKKRKAKVLSPQENLSKITVEPHVQEFYKKYLGNKYFKNGNNPTVIDINGFPVEYDNFYNSLKAIGNVDNEVFNAYVQLFNYDNESLDPKTKQPSKYCFTSYFTEKLLVDPKNFNSRSCLREFKKINSGKNLHKCDLLYFPRVDSFHWTLFCINNLFETVNFFDSRSFVPQIQVNIKPDHQHGHHFHVFWIHIQEC